MYRKYANVRNWINTIHSPLFRENRNNCSLKWIMTCVFERLQILSFVVHFFSFWIITNHLVTIDPDVQFILLDYFSFELIYSKLSNNLFSTYQIEFILFNFTHLYFLYSFSWRFHIFDTTRIKPRLLCKQSMGQNTPNDYDNGWLKFSQR